MSASEILEQIRRLPPEEQYEVAEKVWEEFGDCDDKLAPGEAELIDRRLQDHLDHPDDIVALETVMAKLDAKYGK